MKKWMRTIRLNFLAVSFFVAIISLFAMPQFRPARLSGDNYFHVYLNGQEVGTVGSREDAALCMRTARRRIAAGSDDIVYIDADMTLKGQKVFFGRIDSDDAIVDKMASIMKGSLQSTLTKCFTVKFGTYTINMKSEEEICELLDKVLATYDPDHSFHVSLVPDQTREINVYTSQILSTVEQEKKEERAQELPVSGIELTLKDYFDAVTPAMGHDFSAYKTGVQSMDFGEKIEVVETYLPESQITSLSDAIAEVTGSVDTNQIHEVKSGDTLSSIAQEYGLTMDQLISINPILTDVNSLIRPGDELTVTVAEPRLSVTYTKQEIYEEDYEADTIYKDNDSWYTTKQETIQEPVTGHRKVVAQVTYKDDTKESSKIVMQQTTTEAVPKIIERGTVNPPTYIWPVSGGSVSSGFGSRSRPKAGASTYHEGVDIAVPIGTSVMASSGGTVVTAGWQSGYGNVIYIQHADGIMTRYGHLSKILVHVGQNVSQGQKIALSGNTGNSTGPHLHFEYRINGSAVNPLNYVHW